VLSIVVPTYMEADNLPALARRIDDVLSAGGHDYELLIADDHSSDATASVCEALCDKYPLRLVLPADRARDLSLSVLDGISAANGDKILVMDADLSHPPEMIPAMLECLRKKGGALITGSRYVEGGSFDREWSLWRFLNSHTATLIARPLISCSDPMSGFFMFNKTMIEPQNLNPIGYKIGLEIAVRSRFESIVELPIAFKDREIGESKMSLGPQFKYLRHLRRLYLYKFGSVAEFLHFGAVGASGFVIDVFFYYLLQSLGVSHLVSRAVSFWPAVSWNWVLNRMTTFGERVKRPKTRQWFEFTLSSLFGFAINYGAYSLLTTQFVFFDEYRILALLAGVASASLFNFAASTLFVYSEKRNS
jgi:dolichol-phosphate mannosyltransferase